MVIVRRGHAGDNGCGTQGGGNTVGGREHVEAANSIDGQVDNDKFWESFKGKAMHG